MTIQSQTTRVDYTGNGATTNFPVPFYWLQDTDLLVIRTDSAYTPPTVATLALTTDYVVTGSGNQSGGSITTTVAPTATQKLSILRNVPFTQLTHYVPNDPFPAASHEQALDKLTMETQQLNEGLSRSITLPPNATGLSTNLPLPAASNLIGWNATANALQNVDPTTIATSVTYGNAVADKFSGDGATVNFNLSANPGGINNLDVSISGVTQRPGIDYTWTSGTTLTFTSAPPAGTNNVLARYTQALPVGLLGVGQVAAVNLAAGAVTDTAVATPASPSAGISSTKLSFLQAGTSAVYRAVQERMQDVVSVKDFGAKGDGVTNDTAAIQAALNASTNIFVPDGRYLVDTLYFPNSPSDANPIGGKFIGGPNVIFLQRTANTALFKKVQTAGRLYNWEIGPFSVKPAAGASSTVSAFFTSGFTNCTFNRIQGLSNGTAGFYALFDVAASPYLSYFNTFNNPTLIGTSGYTKCFHFNNNGTGNNGNSNGNTINQPAIYNNSGMASGIDCNLSYSVTINNPYIEANTGMTAIVMGPGTIVNGGALEANGLDFSYTGSNTPFGTIVTGTELATAHNVDFGNTAFGNIWIGVQETGAATWINVNGQSNQKVQLQFSNNPGTPTMSQTLGTTGAIASVSSTVTQGYAQLTRQARLAVRMQFTPADLSNTRLALTAPSGWTIAEISFGVIDSATGISVKSAASINGEVYFTPTTTNAHYVDYWCTLIK